MTPVIISYSALGAAIVSEVIATSLLPHTREFTRPVPTIFMTLLYGAAFYLLTIGLVLTAGINLYQQHRPETTVWGIVISLLSISFMWLLIHHKTKAAHALASPAIMADVACSRACMYLSVALLIASVGYELTGLGFFDAVGALVISRLTYKEGRESFDKARGLACSCSCSCGAARENSL